MKKILIDNNIKHLSEDYLDGLAVFVTEKNKTEICGMVIRDMNDRWSIAVEGGECRLHGDYKTKLECIKTGTKYHDFIVDGKKITIPNSDEITLDQIKNSDNVFVKKHNTKELAGMVIQNIQNDRWSIAVLGGGSRSHGEFDDKQECIRKGAKWYDFYVV